MAPKYFTRDQVVGMYEGGKKERQSGDLAVTWMLAIDNFAYLDKPMLNEQMKIWRKMAKDGMVVIRRCNNKTTTTTSGDTLHFLVVQSTNEENAPNVFGTFVLNEMVSGAVYAFYNKNNRDMVHAFVMKGIYDDSDDLS